MLLSDDGLHASAGFTDSVHYPGRWSMFDPMSAPTVVRVVLATSFALCLVLFLRPTKWISIGSLAALFVSVASLNARAPYAISSAEMYLAAVLFWATLGSVIGWSGNMLRAFRVQIVVVYLSPLLIRFFHGGETWIDGSALRRVVDNPDLRRGPLGSMVEHLPDTALSLATWGTLAVEVGVVVLLVGLVAVPGRITETLRQRIVGFAVGLHVCIALVCGLWFFSAVAILGLLAAVRPQQAESMSLRLWFVPWSVAACVVVWTCLSVSGSPAVAAGKQRNIAAYVVRGAGITQVWGVFSPNPPRAQRWIEMLDANEAVIIDSRTANERIRKLAQNVWSRPDGALGFAWLGFECAKRDVTLLMIRARSSTAAQSDVSMPMPC